MMDVSDGLAKDLGELTPAGLAPALCAPAVPVSRAAHRAARQSRRRPLAHALGDGEDYELLIVVRARADHDGFEQAWRRRFPEVRLSLIGRFSEKSRVPAGALRLGDFRGYEHLQ